MERRFEIRGQAIALHCEPDGDRWRVRLPDGSETMISARHTPDGGLEVSELDDQASSRSFRCATAQADGRIAVSLEGDVFVFAPAEQSRQNGSPRRAAGALAAPMPGIVADVLVTVGQSVAAFQPLAVIEAMKVMATVEAPFEGTVARLHVERGARVRQGEILVDVEPLTARA